jgi:hypothetical protein
LLFDGPEAVFIDGVDMLPRRKYTMYDIRYGMKTLKARPTPHKGKRFSSVVRRSTVLPRRLLEEASAVAPPELRANFNRLVKVALELYVWEQKERLMDAQVAEMGKDPHILAECRKINEEFAPADADGLRQ